MKQVFLHSAPRSGSTWLQCLFESHPNIKSLYQPLFSYEFKNILDKNSNKEDYDKFINNLLNTNDEFCNMKSDYHTNNKEIDLIIHEKKEINTILIKHVSHHNLIETFIKLNPDVKIIGLIRDAKSTIYSQMTAQKEMLKDWLNGTDKNSSSEFYFGFNKWMEVNKLFHDLKLKYPNNIIIVKYEDLVENTIYNIQKICNFCNLEFHDNIINSINLMKSKNEKYDYSVFKKEDTINKWKNLDKEIIDYIDTTEKSNNLKKILNIAICTCFNDVDHLSNRKRSKNSVKSFLTYTQQFEILYESIKKNLKSVNYKIYIFNTIPFSSKLNTNYQDKGIIVLTRQSDHKYYNRPEIYLENIECDYKLVLDVDTIIVNDFGPDIINYIKKYDCMGTYGYRNINKNSYIQILKKLKLKIPTEINLLKNNNNYKWTNVGTYSLNLNKNDSNHITRKFPYFNNGCIIVKNEKSYELGKLWKIKRNEATLEKLLINKGQCGELTIGLCINHLFDNWNHCPKGFNLVCSQGTEKYLNLEVENFTKPYIIHYVDVPYNCNIYNKYMYKYFNKYL